MRTLTRSTRRFSRDEQGVAAIEASMVIVVFFAGLVNTVELARYGFSSMEFASATQAGATAAYANCDPAHVPATTKCPNLQTAVTTAVQSTALGDKVSLKGLMTEGWYCIAAGELEYAGPVSSKPADCSGVPGAVGSPALYLGVNTTYTYEPIFPDITVVAALPKTMLRTSWMRMT
jgi:Flp pilus assembly pilin Flp